MNRSHNEPLVSIIVPVYNVEQYLARSLDSIIKQSLKNIEIIIVNDGSTDSSITIAKKYAKKDSRIKIVNQINKGLGGARNTGIKHSISKYIMFVDSDDTIDEQMSESLYKKAVSANYDIVSCQYNRVDQASNILETSPIDKYSDNSIIDYMESTISVMAWNKLYLKELFTKNNILFPEKLYYEDQVTTFKLFFYSNKHTHIQLPLYNWYITNQSITQSITTKHINDLFEAFNSTKLFLIDKNLYEKYINSFFSRALYITTTHLLNNLLVYNVETNTYIDIIKSKLNNLFQNKQTDFEIIKEINYPYYINYL